MGRPNLSREIKFSGAIGDREENILPVQLTSSRMGNLVHINTIIRYRVSSIILGRNLPLNYSLQ